MCSTNWIRLEPFNFTGQQKLGQLPFSQSVIPQTDKSLIALAAASRLMLAQLSRLLQSQQRPPASSPGPPKPPRPPDDSSCPPGHRPNPARPPVVEKNYYQEPKRLKGKQIRGGSESMSKRPPWDPGEGRKGSLRSEISTLSLHDTDPTFQTIRQPQPKSPAKATKKSKSLPSLSPKGRQVDYTAVTAPRSVDYSYLDKFKPPPVQYQTTREREEGRKSKQSPQPKVGIPRVGAMTLDSAHIDQRLLVLMTECLALNKIWIGSSLP